MSRLGLWQCNRCKFNAGVYNGAVKCLVMKKVVIRIDTNCALMDNSEKPGRVMAMDEFLEAIKINTK